MNHRALLLACALAGTTGGAKSPPAPVHVETLDTTVTTTEGAALQGLLITAGHLLARQGIHTTARTPCLQYTGRLGFLPGRPSAYIQAKTLLGEQGLKLTRENAYGTLQAFELKRAASQETWIGAALPGGAGRAGRTAFALCRTH